MCIFSLTIPDSIILILHNYFYPDCRKKSLPEGNIKALLFGEAARKLQKDFKTISSLSFVNSEHDGQFLTKNYKDYKDFPAANFRLENWQNFKFDRQEILKTLQSLYV